MIPLNNKQPSETAMPDVKSGDSIQSVCSSTALDDFLANDADLKVSVRAVSPNIEAKLHIKRLIQHKC